MRTGPRHGPKGTRDGFRIWTRRIEGVDFLFWSWPEWTAIYRVPDEASPQLVHYFPKDTSCRCPASPASPASSPTPNSG